jgi:hypothetical protein
MYGIGAKMNWLTDWLTDRLIDRQADWLTDWQTDRPTIARKVTDPDSEIPAQLIQAGSKNYLLSTIKPVQRLKEYNHHPHPTEFASTWPATRWKDKFYASKSHNESIACHVA